MPLGTKVGLGSGHTVLDGDPAPPKGVQHPHFSAHVYCGQTPNSWMDQDATWYGSRPQPRPHCVRWGPSSPKGVQHPYFSAHVCCGQTVAHLSNSSAELLLLSNVSFFFFLESVHVNIIQYSCYSDLYSYLSVVTRATFVEISHSNHRLLYLLEKLSSFDCVLLPL